MVYEDNYFDYLELTKELINQRKLATGYDIQVHCLYYTDEDSLSPRERLIMMLPVIKYEVENNLLTEELEDELWFYYKDYNEGRLDGILGDDEEEEVIKDLLECYHKVFG